MVLYVMEVHYGMFTRSSRYRVYREGGFLKRATRRAFCSHKCEFTTTLDRHHRREWAFCSQKCELILVIDIRETGRPGSSAVCRLYSQKLQSLQSKKRITGRRLVKTQSTQPMLGSKGPDNRTARRFPKAATSCAREGWKTWYRVRRT